MFITFPDRVVVYSVAQHAACFDRRAYGRSPSDCVSSSSSSSSAASIPSAHPSPLSYPALSPRLAPRRRGVYLPHVRSRAKPLVLVVDMGTYSLLLLVVLLLLFPLLFLEHNEVCQYYSMLQYHCWCTSARTAYILCMFFRLHACAR